MTYPLAVIDQKAKRVTRYAGKTPTHIFDVQTEITAEKVENIRNNPDGIGQPESPPHKEVT